MRQSTPPSNGQHYWNPRSSATLRSEVPLSLLQPPQTWPPSQASGGNEWQRAQMYLALLSWAVTLPRGQLSPCFVPGQWRQASLALFCSTLHFFISCLQTAHVMLAFHAQYS